ncbi:MAG TPA: hypothetical protein ENH85_09845 [Candidatus Scalindua sp.]|nr:hypothetical protein [Candidatus Scalindua sp.]
MPHKKRNIHYKTDDDFDGSVKIKVDPLAKHIGDMWDEWDGFWGSKLSRFEDFYNRWKGQKPTRDKDWQSQFNKRLSWQSEKALTATMHNILFPTDAPIDKEATEDVDELSAILGKSMVSHWFKIGLFSKEFLSGIRASGIYGTGCFEDDWFIRVEDVPRRVEEEIDDFRPMVGPDGNKIFDEEGNLRSEVVGKRKISRTGFKKEVVEDRYRVRKTNIFAWRIHPHKLTDEDDFPVIKQEFVTFRDLKKMQERSQRLGLQTFDEKLMEEIEHDVFKVDETKATRLQKDGTFTDKKNPRLEILHYWGLSPRKDKDNEELPSWIMIINRKHTLRNIENPFWHKKPPLFHIVWTEDEKPSWYGIGIIEIGENAEDRANNIVNIRTDERKKNIKGGGRYVRSDPKILKTELYENTPGVWRGCTDINNIQPDIPLPKSTPDDYKEEEVATNDYREITGATASILPAADSKKGQPDTLGGMKLVRFQSAQRFKPDLSMMEKMGVRKMANRGYLLTQQFFTKPKAIKVFASKDEKKKLRLDEMYTVAPGQIIGKMNFYCTGLTETLEKGENIDRLLRFAEITGKIPPMQAITNYQNIEKRIALWLGFEDVEDFVLMDSQDPLGQPPQQQQQVPPPQATITAKLPVGQGQGGLPPELLARIAQSVQRGV